MKGKTLRIEPFGNQAGTGRKAREADNHRPTETVSPFKSPKSRKYHRGAAKKVSHLLRWLPSYALQRFTRRVPAGRLHLILALADHFEPAIVPENGRAFAPYDEQERRVERWCKHYPRSVGRWRDHEGRPLVHTYFYPAEQYDRNHLEQLSDFCHRGWGEVEIHLHHGLDAPDSAENTRRVLTEFRDILAHKHSCLSYQQGSAIPRYAFVHGNWALANSANGHQCGVDSEMRVLAETGCYADMTLPACPPNPAQTAKINSLYECGLPLEVRAPHRKGRDLQSGRPPRVFPLIVQGPLGINFAERNRVPPFVIDSAALTRFQPPSLERLKLWKQAAICVRGKPDWLFIKLHCHAMDVNHQSSLLGDPMRRFLSELVAGAPQRNETLHFVSAREMVNIICAACDGKEGNPGNYRDYRFTHVRAEPYSRNTQPPHDRLNHYRIAA